jgi:uncharacterized membrane protein YphA (DoxX/SURF4 family)
MKRLYWIIRISVAVIFIFSGLIKLNDPTGTAIKLEEYFEIFSTDFASFFLVLIPYTLTLSVVMSLLEVVLGVALLVRFKLVWTLILLSILIIFFTCLTFYSAYYNKVTDCGCFGDAIKLTPWQSFTKDVILLLAISFLCWSYSIIKNHALRSTGLQYSIVGATLFFSLFIPLYSLRHLPFIDFLPYRVGANIPALMKPSEPFRYKYIMEKNGELKEFEEYPTDTTYTYKEVLLLNPEAAPKIMDYYVWNDQGDYTQESLKGVKLLLIIPDAEEANKKGIVHIQSLIKELDTVKVKCMALTSSDSFVFELFRHDVQLDVPYYFSDSSVLQAMIRSNPGLILVQNGIVKGKWHYRDIPSAAAIYKLIQ